MFVPAQGYEGYFPRQEDCNPEERYSWELDDPECETDDPDFDPLWDEGEPNRGHEVSGIFCPFSGNNCDNGCPKNTDRICTFDRGEDGYAVFGVERRTVRSYPPSS